jgi:hypothetical protein
MLLQIFYQKKAPFFNSFLLKKSGLLLTTIFSLLLSAEWSFGQPQSWCNQPTNYQLSSGNTTISSLFPNSSSASNVVFVIPAGATLQINKSFKFDTCFFRFGSSASLVVNGTGNISLTGIGCRFFTACSSTDVWNGIIIRPHHRIDLEYCTIRDASVGVSFPGVNTLPKYNDQSNVLKGNTFQDNIIGIAAGNTVLLSSLGANVGFEQCWGNTILMVDGIKNGLAAKAGVMVNHHSNLTFGVGSLGATIPVNAISNLPYGMLIDNFSSAMVYNTDFSNMTDSSSDPNDGTGIYVHLSALSIIGEGQWAIPPTPPTYHKCVFTSNPYCGIYCDDIRGEIHIENVSFNGTEQFGIRYDKSLGNSFARITNNHFTLSNTCQFGVAFRRPSAYSTTHESTISDNFLMNTDDTACILFRFIDVVGATGALNNLSITNNTIVNPSICHQSAVGISVQGLGDNYNIAGNAITFYGSTNELGGWDHGGGGIFFQDAPGNNNAIMANSVSSYVISTNSDIGLNNRSYVKDCIHVGNSFSPTICANLLSGSYRGIHIQDQLSGVSVLSKNGMGAHVFGLLFRNGGATGSLSTISNQIRTGNTWSTNPADYINANKGGKGAHHDDPGLAMFTFFYPPLPLNSGEYPIDNIEYWLLGVAGGNNYCVDTRPTPNLSSPDIAVANGTFPFSSESNTWDLNRELWYQLSKHPEWVPMSSDLQSFYVRTNNSSAQRFGAIQYQFEQAFTSPSSMIADL